VEEKEKKEREDTVNAMRAEERRVATELEKSAIAKSKQIKKEMAAEAALQAKQAAAKAKVHAEKAKAERMEMIRHLKMDTKLRDEDEIANERREGSSMSKGSKDDFQTSAKKKDDMSSF